jgi:hypothetical protein
MDRPVRHKFLVLDEAEAMAGGLVAYLVCSLLSEGRLKYATVVKDSKGNPTERFIEKEGPTGLFLTTTRASVHAENETRTLSVVVSDTPDHTAAVMEMVADDYPVLVDYEAWWAFATWLELGDHEVHIPFARKLARSIPPVGARLRRDFRALLNLIAAHAIVHQWHRE